MLAFLMAELKTKSFNRKDAKERKVKQNIG